MTEQLRAHTPDAVVLISGPRRGRAMRPDLEMTRLVDELYRDFGARLALPVVTGIVRDAHSTVARMRSRVDDVPCLVLVERIAREDCRAAAFTRVRPGRPLHDRGTWDAHISVRSGTLLDVATRAELTLLLALPAGVLGETPTGWWASIDLRCPHEDACVAETTALVESLRRIDGDVDVEFTLQPTGARLAR